MNLALDWLRLKQGEDPWRFLDDVFRYARARLGTREDAEDVAIEVVQALPSPCHRRNLRQYMLGMARRKVADRLRRPTSVQSFEAESSHRFDQKADQAACVQKALAMLEPDHREALLLKYVAELSSAEVGRLMGRSAEAVDSLLQRARAAFEREWKPFSDEVRP